jgi:hypothetical protein
VIGEEQRTLVERLLREKISLHGICRAVGVSIRWLMGFAQFIVATRGRQVDCLASYMDQTCCSISSILRRCAGRQRPVQSLRTRYPQSPDWHPNREGTVYLPASGGDGAGWMVW